MVIILAVAGVRGSPIRGLSPALPSQGFEGHRSGDSPALPSQGFEGHPSGDSPALPSQGFEGHPSGDSHQPCPLRGSRVTHPGTLTSPALCPLRGSPWTKNIFPTRMGFEPTRAEHNGLAVHRLNHSATSSCVRCTALATRPPRPVWGVQPWPLDHLVLCEVYSLNHSTTSSCVRCTALTTRPPRPVWGVQP